MYILYPVFASYSARTSDRITKLRLGTKFSFVLMGRLCCSVCRMHRCSSWVLNGAAQISPSGADDRRYDPKSGGARIARSMYIKRQRRQWIGLARAVRQGKIIAYPCEGVLGVGCDPNNPQAVRRLLKLKKRPWQKGLIVLSDAWRSLSHAVAFPSHALSQKVQSYWPGPVTCLIPVQGWISRGIRGRHQTLAFRISDFEPLRVLARESGGWVLSTSANLAQGRAWSPWGLRRKLGHHQVILGPTGGRQVPSQIRDLVSDRILR